MRTFERIAVGVLALGALTLPIAPGSAYDGAPNSVAPVNVELPPPAASASEPSVAAVEAFRSGTQALRSGDVKAGLLSLQYAAANGHAVAQWKLGRMYAEGSGVSRDDVRAFEYFRGIANAHAEDNPGTPQARFVANAFVALGSYYLEGIPNALKPDPDRAREMFAYAASYFGDADAQYNLGRIYTEGTVGPKDAKLAARWLGLAANKGQFQAQALLGDMLFKGELVPRQTARGLMWLTLASDAAGPQDGWIKDLHAAAFKQASDDDARWRWSISSAGSRAPGIVCRAMTSPRPISSHRLLTIFELDPHRHVVGWLFPSTHVLVDAGRGEPVRRCG
jgi:TPR repeat protein